MQKLTWCYKWRFFINVSGAARDVAVDDLATIGTLSTRFLSKSVYNATDVRLSIDKNQNGLIGVHVNRVTGAR
jgi:hypothetical protein